MCWMLITLIKKLSVSAHKIHLQGNILHLLLFVLQIKSANSFLRQIHLLVLRHQRCCRCAWSIPQSHLVAIVILVSQSKHSDIKTNQRSRQTYNGSCRVSQDMIGCLCFYPPPGNRTNASLISVQQTSA